MLSFSYVKNTKEGVVAAVSVSLQFKRDTGRYLVGERGGRDYWFEKTKIDGWFVEADCLKVELDEALWQRRERAERLETAEPVYKTRNCLRCRKPFGASRLSYVCDPCKETQTWKDGTSMFCM